MAARLGTWVRGERTVRVVAAAGVALILGACSTLEASRSPSTVSRAPSVTAAGASAAGAHSTSTTGPPKAPTGPAGATGTGTSTSTNTASDAGKNPLDPNETNQIDDELAQLQSLLGDTNADFVAGQKEN
ncbi:MAG: hypothetical protein ACLP6E_17910 [Acidimicrobiales bacterium]